jgi:hypothetical protein
MTRSQRIAERAADTAEQRYHTAPRGRKLYRLTLAQHARLRALDAGNRAARRNVRAKERAR